MNTMEKNFLVLLSWILFIDMYIFILPKYVGSKHSVQELLLFFLSNHIKISLDSTLNTWLNLIYVRICAQNSSFSPTDQSHLQINVGTTNLYKQLVLPWKLHERGTMDHRTCCVSLHLFERSSSRVHHQSIIIEYSKILRYISTLTIHKDNTSCVKKILILETGKIHWFSIWNSFFFN